MDSKFQSITSEVPKLNLYVDMSVWLFVGKQYYRLNMSIKSKHIPTKSQKYI